jgi:hypothetical protein
MLHDLLIFGAEGVSVVNTADVALPFNHKLGLRLRRRAPAPGQKWGWLRSILEWKMEAK